MLFSFFCVTQNEIILQNVQETGILNLCSAWQPLLNVFYCFMEKKIQNFSFSVTLKENSLSLEGNEPTLEIFSVQDRKINKTIPSIVSNMQD